MGVSSEMGIRHEEPHVGLPLHSNPMGMWRGNVYLIMCNHKLNKLKRLTCVALNTTVEVKPTPSCLLYLCLVFVMRLPLGCAQWLR